MIEHRKPFFSLFDDSKANKKHFRWGILLVECLKTIVPQLPTQIEVVDYEVIPDLTGGSYGMQVWFICATEEARNLFNRETQASAAITLREEMTRRGFPKSAVVSLRTAVTSRPEIERGGGRFLFFR